MSLRDHSKSAAVDPDAESDKEWTKDWVNVVVNYRQSEPVTDAETGRGTSPSASPSTYSADGQVFGQAGSSELFNPALESETRIELDRRAISADAEPQGVSKDRKASEVFPWVRGPLLAEGSYASVYLATRTSDKKRFAAKQVDLTLPADDPSLRKEEAKMLEAEYELLKSLRHPNIIEAIGLERLSDSVTLFLEYLPNGSIENLLVQHTRFLEPVAKHFTKQIALGLEYLHGVGIIHKDLKPDNVLVESYGQCKISTFGRAERRDPTSIDKLLRSPSDDWGLPFPSDGRCNAKTDIWNLSLIILEMLTGRSFTYEYLSPKEDAAKLSYILSRVNLLALSSQAKFFVSGLCQLDPSIRPSASDLLREPWLEQVDTPTIQDIRGFGDGELTPILQVGPFSNQERPLNVSLKPPPIPVSTGEHTAEDASTSQIPSALDVLLTTLAHLRIDPSRLAIKDEENVIVGGFGDVSTAVLDEGTETSLIVAVKELRPSGTKADRARMATRLARELNLWSKLKHPNILQLTGFSLSEDKRIAQLVSPFQAYGSVVDYIESQSPSETIRLQLALDTIAGLEYLHSRNPPMCHGDLKANNVLVTGRHRAVLCDFGLATLLDTETGLTTSNRFKGFARHLAPEIFMQEGFCRTLQSDIWAWACTCLQILWGLNAYSNRNDPQVVVAVMNKELPVNLAAVAIVPEPFKLLFLKCWSVHPDDRPTAQECHQMMSSLC